MLIGPRNLNGLGLPASLRGFRRAQGSSAVAAAVMPAGALLAFHASEFDTAKNAVPNKASANQLSANIFRGSRRKFGEAFLWNLSNTTVVDANKSPGDGTTDGSTITGAAGWAVRPTATTYTLPAGVYTAVAKMWTDSGTATVGWTKNFAAGITRENSTAINTTPTRYVYNFTLASPTVVSNIALCDITGATAATFNLVDFELYSGTYTASDVPGPQAGDTHMYLGTTAFDTRRVITAGKAVGHQSIGIGSIQFPAGVSFAAGITVLTVSRRVAVGPVFQPYLANMGASWQSLAIGHRLSTATGLYWGGSNVGAAQPTSDLFKPPDSAWNFEAHRYSGTQADQFIEDIKALSNTVTVAAPTALKDFWVGGLSAPGTYYGAHEWNTLYVYNKTLTDAEILTAREALRAKAVADGLTLWTERYVFNFGDSLAAGAAGTPDILQYGPNAAYPVRGAKYGIGGSSQSSLTAQFVTFDAKLPASLAGKTIVEVINTLTNDLGSGSAAADASLISLATKLDARRTLGRKVVMHTVLGRTDAASSGGAAFNTDRAYANPEIRLWAAGTGTISPGVHVDAVADWAANATIGTNTAPDNATYFPDKLHPSTAAYAIGEANYLRAAVNGLL